MTKKEPHHHQSQHQTVHVHVHGEGHSQEAKEAKEAKEKKRKSKRRGKKKANKRSGTLGKMVPTYRPLGGNPLAGMPPGYPPYPPYYTNPFFAGHPPPNAGWNAPGPSGPTGAAARTFMDEPVRQPTFVPPDPVRTPAWESVEDAVPISRNYTVEEPEDEFQVQQTPALPYTDEGGVTSDYEADEVTMRQPFIPIENGVSDQPSFMQLLDAPTSVGPVQMDLGYEVPSPPALIGWVDEPAQAAEGAAWEPGILDASSTGDADVPVPNPIIDPPAVVTEDESSILTEAMAEPTPQSVKPTWPPRFPKSPNYKKPPPTTPSKRAPQFRWENAELKDVVNQIQSLYANRGSKTKSAVLSDSQMKTVADRFLGPDWKKRYADSRGRVGRVKIADEILRLGGV